jgi:CDP-diacylglycerol--glycerol-3-phosphate 3-phosphatidyltransferase
VLDGNHRHTVARLTNAPATRIARLGINAHVVTLTGLLAAVVVACTAATGHFAQALGALVVAGLADLLDGPVARAAQTTSTRGAYLDSVSDRIADALILGGLTWYLAGTTHPRNAMIPFAILAATTLVSYQRAKAESLGLVARGGLMERAERFIALGLALLIPTLLVPILYLVLVLTAFTALTRFFQVYAQTTTVPTLRARHPALTASHWRNHSPRSNRATRRGFTTPSTRKLRARSHRRLTHHS